MRRQMSLAATRTNVAEQVYIELPSHSTRMQDFGAVQKDVEALPCTVKPWPWLLFSSNVILGDLLCWNLKSFIV